MPKRAMKIETEFGSRKLDLARAKPPHTVLKRSLIVDDEPAMRELIQEVLKGVDIETVLLAGSLDADHYFRNEKFDLIIVGLSKPAGGGNELVVKIRETGLNRTTPIILISEDQRPVAVSLAFQAGATFFAYKPIDRPHLMRLVRATQGTVEREKRRFRRVPVQAKVRIRSARTEIEGETIDISLNGVLVAAPHSIPVGSMVEISLYLLAGAKPIVGLGTIVRTLSDNRMGILLDRIPPAESGRLQEYLLPKISD
jgi:DNA-binding response OmpR family regulator